MVDFLELEQRRKLLLTTLVVGYKRKGHFFSKTWLDISERGKFGPGSRLDIHHVSARGNLETSKIVWLGIGARQKFAPIVVGYKRKGKIWTKIMVGYKRKGKSVPCAYIQPPVSIFFGSGDKNISAERFNPNRPLPMGHWFHHELILSKIITSFCRILAFSTHSISSLSTFKQISSKELATNATVTFLDRVFVNILKFEIKNILSRFNLFWVANQPP